MGTSLALALREHDIDVQLSDVRSENVDTAVSLGAGRPGPDGAPGLVVVAVPPSAVSETVVAALREWPEAIVTDLSSVKSEPGRAVAESDGAARYAGSHPMAGSERSGPLAASGQLFEGRAWAVTPGSGSGRRAVEVVHELARLAGAAAIEMDAAEHDQAVALVSHLPHLLSVLAASQLHDAPSAYLELAGPGLRDVTRVAGSDTWLWQQILSGNAEPVRSRLESVRDELDALIAALGSNPAAVGNALTRGKSGTELIPGKHGGTATASVFVQVPDRPGSLSTLMTHAKDSGINVEDFRIEHGMDRPIGIAEMMVPEERADALVDVLANLGWSVYR